MNRSRGSNRSDNPQQPSTTSPHPPGPHTHHFHPDRTAKSANTLSQSSFIHIQRHTHFAGAASSSNSDSLSTSSRHLTRSPRSLSRPGSPAQIDTALSSADVPSRNSSKRIFPLMRRSQSCRRASECDAFSEGMFSTPAERLPVPLHTGRMTEPPSIAQIAMGLHTSRTPHLRPTSKRINSDSAALKQKQVRPQSVSSSQSVSAHRDPLAPLRPSLKKTSSLTLSSRPSRSTSPSVSTSSAPRTPQPHSALGRLSFTMSSKFVSSRTRLERFIGLGSGNSQRDDHDDDAETPRKSVRFISIDEDTVSDTDVKVVMVAAEDEHQS